MSSARLLWFLGGVLVAILGTRIGRFLRRRATGFRYAFRGLRILLSGQTNARIHAVATLLVLVVACWLRPGVVECGLLVAAMTAVWVAEALNTAVELLTNLVSPEYRPLAGQVKDVAAGAVLLAALGSVVTAVLVFGPLLRGGS